MKEIYQPDSLSPAVFFPMLALSYFSINLNDKAGKGAVLIRQFFRFFYFGFVFSWLFD